MPNGTAEEWEAGWRHGVNERLSSFDGKLDTIVEGMQKLITRMTLNEEAVRDMRDSKKAAPRITQGWVEIGCLCYAAFVSTVAVLFGLINLLAAHWH